MQHTRFIANKTVIFNFSIWRTSAVNRRENCLSGKFPINPGKIALLPRAGFRTDWHVSEAKSLICEWCRIMQFSAENFLGKYGKVYVPGRSWCSRCCCSGVAPTGTSPGFQNAENINFMSKLWKKVWSSNIWKTVRFRVRFCERKIN